jgi:fibronectin type 3 domain-containing protein
MGTSYTDTGLSWGVTYYYVVRAYDTSGNESADSLQAVATTVDSIPPAGITNFRALDGVDGQSPLSWTNPVDVALGEVVVLRTTGGYPSGHADFGAATVYGSTTPVSGGTVSVVDSGLTNGTTYYYTVYARDAAGNWNDATTAGQNADTAVPSNVAPAAPTAVAAADQPGDQGGAIVLTWAPSTSPGILEQRISRSTAVGGPYTLIQTIGDNTTQMFVDAGLVNGVTYYYVVRAFNGTRESADSNQASAAPIDNLAPLAPTALAVVDTPSDQGGSIDLTWTPSTSADVIQQRVYRSTTAGGSYTLVQTIAGRTTSAYTDTGIVNGTTYYYVVAAFDGSQESAPSSEASAAPIDNLVPPEPLNLIASDRPADQGGAIDLFWSPSTGPDVTQQRVYRSAAAGGPYTLAATILNNATNAYTDTGLVNGTAYYYVVAAFDGTQESPVSNEASAIPADNLAPAVPTGLSATDVPADSGGAITLAWTPSTSPDVTQQRVYRSLTSGGLYGLVTTISNNTTTTYTDSGLTAGTTYYYVLRAFDGTLESGNSNQAALAPVDNGTYHLHNEFSLINTAARQLRQAGPDVAAATIQSPNLRNATGINIVTNFETQSLDPNVSRTFAAGSTFSFTIYMQKSANTAAFFPYVALYKNTATAGNLVCSAAGATQITTTMTAYTLSCQVAGGFSLVPADRFFLAVGVNITTPTANQIRAIIGVEGILNGATDSRMVVPWP